MTNIQIKLKLISLCCLLTLSLGCGGAPKLASDEKTPPTVAAVSASDNPREDLTRAINAQFNARSYRARMASSTSDGANATIVVEFVSPDRLHMTSESDKPDRSRQETIVVGKDTYMKIGTGQWQKSPMNMGEMISKLRDPKMVDELAKSADVKFIGPDVLDGTAVKVYQYTLKEAPGKDIKSTSKTWIGDGDGLPRKSESESEMNLMGKQVKSKTVTTYSDYNADIKIEPPIK